MTKKEVSPSQLAAFCGVENLSKIYQWLWDGKIRSKKVGKHYVIDLREALEDIRANHLKVPPEVRDKIAYLLADKAGAVS